MKNVRLHLYVSGGLYSCCCSDWSVSHSVCLVSLRVLVCLENERFYGRSHPINLYEQFTVRGCRQHVVILQFIRARLQTARGCYYVGFSTITSSSCHDLSVPLSFS